MRPSSAAGLACWCSLLLIGAAAFAILSVNAEESSEVDLWGVLQLKKYLAASTKYLEDHMQRLKSCGTASDLAALRESPVLEVKDGRTLSFRQFYNEYALRRRPVLIKNYMGRMFPGVNITTETVRAKCGHKTVYLQSADKNSKTWGGLNGGQDAKLAEFLDGTKEDIKNLYLHDWPLSRGCPELLEDYVVPKYFASDFVHRIPTEQQDSVSWYDAWPSLFVGRKGTFSALHVDTFGLNFWMLLLEGSKHWRFFPHEDRPLLYESPETQSFDVDAFNPDYEKYPLLAFARSYDVILQPGDLLFVPGGTPHQVFNPEYSVAMSGNFVDGSNFDMVIEELQLSADAGYEGSRRTLEALTDENLNKRIFLDDQHDMPFFSEFSRQEFDDEGYRVEASFDDDDDGNNSRDDEL